MKWSSSNPAVATLRRGGSATLLSAGTATIAASMGGQKASTVLTVTVAVSPVFTAQPADTNVSAVIDAGGGVKVQLLDNGGPFRPENYRGNRHQPAGNGALTGTLTQNHRLGWPRDVSRERKVIAMVVSGMPNKKVAAQIGIAENTVKVHRSRAMEKTRAQSFLTW